MSPTLIARASSPALQATRKHFSTTTPFLKSLTSESAPSTSSSTKWRWSNLSPRTRRYILVGLAVSTCVDSYVVYNYWSRIFGSE
ncbi:ATP-dependent DNA helicase srs2 [Fusarium piperis]|uniref:ATP-dependent DNA helicase srs2 n=1 Tax=Fusarium piperis TaxID=1435070 RepID=A0A9W8WJ68_9HYPO|nr:ATP-dependent DNA helicase srs2 [Fusarium piperis]